MNTYSEVSSVAYEINGILMKDGEFMDADKRKIVFTVVSQLHHNKNSIKKIKDEEGWIDNDMLTAMIIKKLSADNKFSGREYWLWRKSKIGKYGNLEQFIDYVIDMVINTKEIYNRIIS